MERCKAVLGELGGMGLRPQCDYGVKSGEAAFRDGLVNAACLRRRGDRIGVVFAALHESGCGTGLPCG
jgi:hypothetical protein